MPITSHVVSQQPSWSGAVQRRYSLREFCGRISGREGKPVDVSLIYRWARRGVHGITLPTVYVPGTGLTITDEDYEAWIGAVNAARSRASVGPDTEGPL